MLVERQEDYHIEATESLVGGRFARSERRPVRGIRQSGICRGALGPDGLSTRTRGFLIEFTVRLGGAEPLQLGSCCWTIRRDGGRFTNADRTRERPRVAAARVVHLSRFKFLSGNSSFGAHPAAQLRPIGRTIPMEIAFDADFADLFEVRGTRREQRGARSVHRVSDGEFEFRYLGLDQVTRTTRLHFDPPPNELRDGYARWDVDLDDSREQTIVIKSCCLIDEDCETDATIATAFRAGHKVRRSVARQRARLDSSNPQFDAVIARAWSDLDMLMTETAHALSRCRGPCFTRFSARRDHHRNAVAVLRAHFAKAFYGPW